MKKIIATLFAVLIVLSTLIGCGASDPNRIDFVVQGSDDEVVIYTEMVNEFNRTYGAEHGITAKITSKPVGSYKSYIQTTSSSKTGPDVLLVVEDDFKGYVGTGIIGDVTEELNAVTDVKWNDIYSTMINRYRYNKETNTSDDSDPIYGLPIDTKPTALFYNETLFRQAGILVISVDEADLDDFVAGNKADRRGKTWQQYVADYDAMKSEGIVTDGAATELKAMTRIPKKGYYRSVSPYTGGTWEAPVSAGTKIDEVLIFNNRIAMNWDEVEDLAMIFSAETNPSPDKTRSKYHSEYGYFTEWWFNYGWSVGGDCLTDLTGKGDWNFSLLDPNPNFIVAEGKTYTGAYTGKTYSAGETIAMNDRLNVPAGETLVPDSVGGYTYDGKAVSTRPEVLAAAEEKTLRTLPSTREAFERYLKLGAATNVDVGGKNGLNVAPNPNLFNQRTAVNYFFSGDLAMMVNYSIYMTEISDYMAQYNYTWDVAPLVRYKKYVDPSDPASDEVDIMGVEAGHSNSTAMVVRKNSPKKENAAKFIAWMASEKGQQMRVSKGFFPNQASLLDKVTVPGASATVNKEVFADALAFQRAGDWWYMPDYEWINTWAVPLNTYVRNGEQYTYSAWYQEFVSKTNAKLREY